MVRMRLLEVWLVILLLPVAPLSAYAVQQQSYVFAVIPSSPPVTTFALWTPFVERVSREGGVNLQLKVYERMAEFERDLSTGVPDFIFANPFQTVIAHRTHEYQPLVRSSKMVSVGVFVLKESPVRTVEELSNKKIAFVGNKNL